MLINMNALDSTWGWFVFLYRFTRLRRSRERGPTEVYFCLILSIFYSQFEWEILHWNSIGRTHNVFYSDDITTEICINYWDVPVSLLPYYTKCVPPQNLNHQNPLVTLNWLNRITIIHLQKKQQTWRRCILNCRKLYWQQMYINYILERMDNRILRRVAT